LLCATRAKELAHNFGALRFHHAAYDFESMVQPAIAANIIYGTQGPRLFVPRAIDDPRDSSIDHRADAHHARLERDVDRNRGEAIGLQMRRGRSDREDLRMRGRIVKPDRLVMPRADDLSARNRDCADRDFAFSFGAGLREASFTTLREAALLFDRAGFFFAIS